MALAVLLAAGSVPFVRQLGLDTDWAAMLPETKPSVIDLKRVAGRVGGLATLTLVLQSNDTDALTRYATALVPVLEARKLDGVRSVDWNVSAYEDFVREHRYLYASTEDLREVRNSLEDRLVYEKSKANPFFIALEDPPDDPEVVIKRLEEKAEKKRGAKGAKMRGGFYLHESGKYLVIFLRTDIRGGDVKSSSKLIASVDEIVRASEPTKYAKDMKVEYTGELLTAREEYDAIVSEVVIATGLTIVLVLLVIYLLFWRLRAVPLLGFSIVTPTLLTFAIAEFTVDTLNTSTAFLGTVVIGNGINPGFNWLARYFEERRAGHGVEEAVARTHAGVWRGTLAAAVAGSLSYGSLMIANFKGFQDFGTITGVGMLVCWAAMFLFLPAFTVISERARPLVFTDSKDRGTLYGAFFWRIASRAPRAAVTVFAALVLASIVLVSLAVARDPLEYDFRKLRSTGETTSRASELGGYVKQIVGKAATGNAIAVLVDRREDVAPLEKALEAKSVDPKRASFGTVRTVDDLLPDEQGAKVQILGEIRALLLDMRRFADDDLAKRIDANLPPKFITPLQMEDLPEAVARPYSEKDGTRGRVLFVESRKGISVWDGRYLVEWAAAIRSVSLPNGDKPALAGRAPVFADMLEVVVDDGPRAVGLSFLATVILVLLTFRRLKDSLHTLGAHLVGIVIMTGAMAAFDIKLNFLNFLAFPIAFGNGVDYAVNVIGRFVQERDENQAPVPEAVRRAVTETGGAVVLCSLSTVIGYISLFASDNRALNSFGASMAISEIACLLTAMIALPALLLLRARKP